MSSAQRPVLCLVVDRHCSATPIDEAVEAAVAAGVDWIQIRERGLETTELICVAEDLAAAARRAAGSLAIAIIVNRRLDVALALGSEGVHLGFDALSAEDARSLLGHHTLIGVSTHSIQEVAAAARAGASYAHLAPIFPPLSKLASRPCLNADGLAEAARHPISIIAQGGVEARRCADVLAAGAAGVAVTGAILMSQNPGAAAAELRQALDEAAARTIPIRNPD